MKRCQKCNFQSDAMLDYCWQCGSQLNAASSGGQFYQGAPRTQNYSFPNQNYNSYAQQQTGANGYQPRQTVFSLGRVLFVLAGIFTFILAVTGAGAFVIYKLANKPPVRTYEEYRKTQPPVKESEPYTTAPEDKNSSGARAEFEKMWVDYNVTENGRLGMRIHVKFSVVNMKDVDSELAIYFEKSDGTKLKSKSKKFSSKNGQATAYRALKPGYDETVYKDLDVFMPYDELNLGSGKFDLKMDVDVIKENGDLVEHLNYYDFQYEKK